MVTQASAGTKNRKGWPRKVSLGRVTVTVYRRKTPSGNPAFMVANYAGGKRRFDSYADEVTALEAAGKLARQLSEREVVAAALTNDEAAAYSAAAQALADFPGVGVLAACETVAGCLRVLPGGLSSVLAAAEHYAASRAQVTPRSVTLAVADYVALKTAQGASPRYVRDLNYRLNAFAGAFKLDLGAIQTGPLQQWLDGLKLAPQGVRNFRTVLGGLFNFGKSRGWCSSNPAVEVSVGKMKSGVEPAIFTADEFDRLLRSADADFLPVLVLGGLAGCRTAEIERVRWEDINLASGELVIGAAVAKTRSRRVVPLGEAALAWLAPYQGRTGRVWPHSGELLFKRERLTAEAAGIPWKANGLRHGYASHRLAVTGDAVRVAHEMGNSAAVVHRHYKSLVNEAAGKAWFAIQPERPANVTSLAERREAFLKCAEVLPPTVEHEEQRLQIADEIRRFKEETLLSARQAGGKVGMKRKRAKAKERAEFGKYSHGDA